MFEVVGSYRGKDIYQKIDTNYDYTDSFMLLFLFGDVWTVFDEECMENKRWYITGKCLGAPELTEVWNIWNGENWIEDPKITAKKQKMINVYGKYIFTEVSSSGYPMYRLQGPDDVYLSVIDNKWCIHHESSILETISENAQVCPAISYCGNYTENFQINCNNKHNYLAKNIKKELQDNVFSSEDVYSVVDLIKNNYLDEALIAKYIKQKLRTNCTREDVIAAIHLIKHNYLNDDKVKKIFDKIRQSWSC